MVGWLVKERGSHDHDEESISREWKRGKDLWWIEGRVGWEGRNCRCHASLDSDWPTLQICYPLLHVLVCIGNLVRTLSLAHILYQDFPRIEWDRRIHSYRVLSHRISRNCQCCRLHFRFLPNQIFQIQTCTPCRLFNYDGVYVAYGSAFDAWDLHAFLSLLDDLHVCLLDILGNSFMALSFRDLGWRCQWNSSPYFEPHDFADLNNHLLYCRKSHIGSWALLLLHICLTC